MIDIGSSGTFHVLEPFKLTDETHTCTGKSTVSNLIALGFKVYESVYLPLGISEDAFKEILLEDPVILTLKTVRGVASYIPESKVTTLDTYTTVKYVNKAMVINLGNHHTDKTFITLANRIKDIIKEHEGIDITSTIRDVSIPASISRDDHESILLERGLAKARYRNPLKLLQKRESHIEVLESRINALTDYIIQYMKQCSTDGLCGDGTGGTGNSGGSDGGDTVIIVPVTLLDKALISRCKRARSFKLPGFEETYFKP